MINTTALICSNNFSCFFYKGILGQLLVPLPPLNELNAIVKKIDGLMALCEQLKARLADAQTTQLYLADAVVENALT
jgi:type I restriction enzyme S subunit